MKWNPWRNKKQNVVYGDVIKSPVAEPRHAEILRALNHNKRQGRMYDSAVTTQMNMDFPSTYGSADAELLNSLYISRNRARTLVKDYPIAKGIVRNFKNNVVGDDPFRLEMKVGTKGADGKFTLDSEINEMIEAWWKEAGEPENCTVRKTWSRLELYHMIEAEAITAGGILAQHFDGFGNGMGYAIDCLEVDRLDQNYMGKAEGTGNNIRFSVEMDQYNAPVAYWLLTRHPGDVFGYTKTPVGKTDKWRVRIDAKDIIHFMPMRDRAEQTVGMTELDSVIQQLHRDRQFDVAHVYAAIWASCKPFFIVQEFPTGLPYMGDPSMMANFAGGTPPIASGEGDGKGGGVNKVKVQEPASGEILPWGQKPMLVDPKFPTESAVGFKKANLEATGMGVGQSYHEVSNDYTGLSFSAARMAAIPSRDNYKVLQHHMICSFVQLHFRRALQNVLLTDYFEKRFGKSLPMSRYQEFCRAAHFHGKRWGYINPLQDAQTDIMLKEALLKSPQEIRAESEHEGSIEDVYRQISEANEIAETYDLDSTSDATKPALQSGQPGETQPVEDGSGTPAAPAKTGGKNPMNAKSKMANHLRNAQRILDQFDDFGEPHRNGNLNGHKIES